MSRIPAVGAQHVDVSMLLQEVSALRAEVRSMAQIRTEIADIGHVLGASRSGEVTATNDVGATAEAADSISYAATARSLQHGGMKEKKTVVEAKKTSTGGSCSQLEVEDSCHHEEYRLICISITSVNPEQ